MQRPAAAASANILPATLNTDVVAVNGDSSVTPGLARHQRRNAAAVTRAQPLDDVEHDRLGVGAGRRPVLRRRDQRGALRQRGEHDCESVVRSRCLIAPASIAAASSVRVTASPYFEATSRQPSQPSTTRLCRIPSRHSSSQVSASRR